MSFEYHANNQTPQVRHYSRYYRFSYKFVVGVSSHADIRHSANNIAGSILDGSTNAAYIQHFLLVESDQMEIIVTTD